MTRTHYVKGFTSRDAQGRQETACGIFVPETQAVSPGIRPTCWGCAAWLDSLEDDRADHQIPASRPLTRNERLQRLADAGCDTWAEYDGLR